MQKRRLGNTSLEIAPLVFGGNVFGWTADEPTSFAMLDRFFEAGLNAIDTADVYSRWVPGNSGGESETIIGNWMKSRGNRDSVVVVTKVGSDMGQGHRDLSARWIEQAVEHSLRRLQTDAIDLYLSHWPDERTSYEETLRAYDVLLSKGKVRFVGVSNVDARQLSAALSISARKDLPRYQVLQPEYNLYDRSSFEGPLRDLCIAENIGVITYYSLASGFLTGKYRSEADLSKSPRGGGIREYLNDRGARILAALDSVAAARGAAPAEVALAWVMAQPGVTAPIASATSVEQVESLIRSVSLSLSKEEIAALTEASA
jgi:aryl-alcohol dehydrogenase-like predicted oxidoreductase